VASVTRDAVVSLSSGQGARRAFTLLELAIAIVIIAILAGLILAVVGQLRARAQRAVCMANLRSLSTAANLYVQQHGNWPQVPVGDAGSSTEEYAEAWIAALSPFGIERKTWICARIQNLLQNPDYTKPENARVDYIATPFDDKPTTSAEWPRQPWFVEAGDVHGNGNLIIFTDGSISDLGTVMKESGRK
jgi:prepilin-type N-terminal cleavage/methylation domain-containing protein